MTTTAHTDEAPGFDDGGRAARTLVHAGPGGRNRQGPSRLGGGAGAVRSHDGCLRTLDLPGQRP
jgi:hypothetical protein